MSSVEAPIFEALIVPYRSLTTKGAVIVVGALVVMTAAVAFRFWLLGAWPVLVFACVEIPLLVVLLTINMRGARAKELIMLDATQVTVLPIDPADLAPDGKPYRPLGYGLISMRRMELPALF